MLQTIFLDAGVEFIYHKFDKLFVKTSNNYKNAEDLKLTDLANMFAPAAVSAEPMPTEPYEDFILYGNWVLRLLCF